jgi:hypothetical protein
VELVRRAVAVGGALEHDHSHISGTRWRRHDHIARIVARTDTYLALLRGPRAVSNSWAGPLFDFDISKKEAMKWQQGKAEL